MPITPTYPGVYIEEIPSGVHTITGVATSIAAFFGRTAKGPLNKAVRCFNYSDFTRAFGGAHPSSDLAQSVRQFFNNGGNDCYVIRLAKGATKSTITLLSLNGEKVLTARAKVEGVWANTVRLVVDYNTPNPDETFNLKVIQEEGGSVIATESFTNLSMNPDSSRFAPDFVTQSSELIKLELHADAASGGTADITVLANSFSGFSQARRPLGATGANVKTLLDALIAPGSDKYKFDINVNDTGWATVNLKDVATIPGTKAGIEGMFKSLIEGAIQTIDPSLTVLCHLDKETISAYDTGYFLTIKSNFDNFSSVRVRRASSNDISAALMLGIDQGGIEAVRWSNFRPVPTASYIDYVDPTATTPHVLNVVNSFVALKQNEFTTFKIDSYEVNLTGDYSIVTTVGTDRWIEDNFGTSSANGNNDGVREKLRIIANAINDDSSVPYKAEVWGYHLAIMAETGNINTKPTTIETLPLPSVLKVDVPNNVNRELKTNVRQYSLGTASSQTYASGFYCDDGANGSDGIAPTKADYVGKESDQTGFHALDKVDIFNLMVLPDDEEVDFTDIWGPASIYCEKKRAFLLIDAPPNWTNPNTGLAQVVQDTTKVDNLRATVTNISSAVFYPRLKYKFNGLNKLIGPSGAIAGLMARTDAARGVWKAPAGTDADIRGILGLEVKLTDMENGVLNKLAVNCLREFPGSYVCWGSRTMDGYDNNSKDDWKYIPVRRLALFLEESLFRGTKWVVFEPNDEPLWAKIRLNVGAFMMRLFRQGAFQGTTPDKAFYVKCDSETTPQADINLGIVNIEVGFAPLKPAEFVIIKIQQIAGEL
jgi:phage tail sheath protein FI